MSFKFEGSKYKETKGLDIAEIAKLVRAEIKEKHPGIKTSVRIERYAGGRSLNVEIKGVPFKILSTPEGQRYSLLANDLKKSIEGIVNQYNFDNSDSMTDYFHVRFYTHIEFDFKIEEKELSEGDCNET